MTHHRDAETRREEIAKIATTAKIAKILRAKPGSAKLTLRATEATPNCIAEFGFGRSRFLRATSTPTRAKTTRVLGTPATRALTSTPFTRKTGT